VAFPTFDTKERALDVAKQTARQVGNRVFAVCSAGTYTVRLNFVPGHYLATWYARVEPDGTVVEGF
jgi:hypothetical protein